MARWRGEDAHEAAAERVSRDPRMFPVGYFGGDDTGLFFWFADETEMLEFLVEAEPEIYERDDAAEVTEELRQAVGEGPKTLSDGLLEELNQIFDGEPFIGWWGRFDQLLSGDGEFAVEIRNAFFDSPEAETAPPVPSHRVEEFIDWMREYGVE